MDPCQERNRQGAVLHMPPWLQQYILFDLFILGRLYGHCHNFSSDPYEEILWKSSNQLFIYYHPLESPSTLFLILDFLNYHTALRHHLIFTNNPNHQVVWNALHLSTLQSLVVVVLLT